MVRHVIATHADAVKGTELDPAALRARREKLIAQGARSCCRSSRRPPPRGGDVAAQLKQAMRANAFGDLRFSGRDPIEVIDELRAQWADAGPMLDDADRAQGARVRRRRASRCSTPPARAPRARRAQRRAIAVIAASVASVAGVATATPASCRPNVPVASAAPSRLVAGTGPAPTLPRR